MGKEKTPQTLNHPRYVSNGVLGTGTYGHVLRCIDQQTGEVVAVKVSHKESAYRRSALNEASILKTLNLSPNVLRMRETFEHEGRIHIACDMLHINLYELMRQRKFAITPLGQCREIGSIILKALGEVHAAGFMHCDVKPENVMMRSKHSETDCCLIDFGAIRRFHENQYYDIQSLWYRAPEVIAGVPYTTAIDIWSVGCMLYELHTGNPLFAGNDPQEQINLIIDLVGQPSQESRTTGKNSYSLRFTGSSSRTPKFLEDSIVGADPLEIEMFADVLYQMLSPDESQRYTVADCLKHPFFSGAEKWNGPTSQRMAFLRNQSMSGITDSSSALNSPEWRRAQPIFDEEDDSPGMSTTGPYGAGSSQTVYQAPANWTL